MCSGWITGAAVYFFFVQAEDGIRDKLVTGVQTCALPISPLDFRVHSDDFDPGVAIYHNGGSPITSGSGRRFTTDARVNYVTPAAGTYEIAVFAANDQAVGEVTLDGGGPAPAACGPPSIIVPP